MATNDIRHEQMFRSAIRGKSIGFAGSAKFGGMGAGEPLFMAGDVTPGMFIPISGSVRVTRRDPLGQGAPIVEQGPGEFVAEVGQLSGQPALVDVHAIDNVEALLVPPENLRTLMIEEIELGEKIMRALILRRPGRGWRWWPVLIGARSSPDMVRLQGFLARNAHRPAMPIVDCNDLGIMGRAKLGTKRILDRGTDANTGL